MGAADRDGQTADCAYRRRITEAIAEIAHERSLGAAGAEELCRRSGVSRESFDRLFPSTEDALCNAFAEAFDSIFVPVGEAVAAGATWLEGLAGALDALLEVASEKPRLAELCIVHSPEEPAVAAGNDYPAAVAALAAVLQPARAHAEADPERTTTAPPLAEEFLAHGILFEAGQLAQGNQPADVEDRGRDLLMLALLTFFGIADAARMCDELE